MKRLYDLSSVQSTLRKGIAKGYWTMQDLDVPPPEYVGKNFRNLLRDYPADPPVADVGKAPNQPDW